MMMQNTLKASHKSLSCFPDCAVANQGRKSSKEDPLQGAEHTLLKSLCLGSIPPFGTAPKHRTSPGLYS